MISLEQVCMKYDQIIILASNDVSEFLRTLNNIGIDAIAIDYDPKFENKLGYVNKDFVFDDVDLTTDLNGMKELFAVSTTYSRSGF